MNLRYHNITTEDMKNGMGLRTVLWLSHCEHKCEGCHNPQTWSEYSGIPFDTKSKNELFDKLQYDYISGLTLSGGDPLSCINRIEITNLLKEVKNKFTEIDIWCYTGYNWDEIKDLEAVKYIDVLIDGKFEKNLSVPSPEWCGSSNQRIIDVHESLKQNKVILYTE
jgi:anaerobic ribonucleoside-triphosphate reductase activating protein